MKRVRFIIALAVLAAMVALIATVWMLVADRGGRACGVSPPVVVRPDATHEQQTEAPSTGVSATRATLRHPIAKERLPAGPRPTAAILVSVATTAATAVPDPLRLSDAQTSSILADLRTIRSQLQLYKSQHNEQYPQDLELQMTKYTDAAGAVGDQYSDRFRYGPYVLKVPSNPLTAARSTSTVDDAAAAYMPADDLRGGWWYNSATGEFRCHVPDYVLTAGGDKANSQ